MTVEVFELIPAERAGAATTDAARTIEPARPASGGPTLTTAIRVAVAMPQPAAARPEEASSRCRAASVRARQGVDRSDA
ncbi:hypothetical protein ACIBTZ_22290 [Micromonospora sp. NPDC049460]|uniref:hypothetical protein n=1 Tax=Micromonospora sp. NPDC049460 TaxID=3364272 RepID=UPI00378B35EB